jgi:hypothetical protein
MWHAPFLSRLRQRAATNSAPKSASGEHVAPMSDRQLAKEIRHLSGLRFKTDDCCRKTNQHTTYRKNTTGNLK